MPAQTIDEVIRALDDVVDGCKREADQIGYFAALYRRVTIAVKEGIARGEFEDGPRMERLDVIFANRYLAALEQYRRSEPPTRCWAVAFDATGKHLPIILQQLLLGMNAHINVDLGVAAAQVASGDAFSSLKNDFNRINQVLASLLDRVQDQIDSLSPALAWLDRVGARNDEAVVNFSIERARDAAWSFAGQLAIAPAESRAGLIALRDEEIAALGRMVERPRPLVSLALLWIRLRESGDVARNITVLGAP